MGEINYTPIINQQKLGMSPTLYLSYRARQKRGEDLQRLKLHNHKTPLQGSYMGNYLLNPHIGPPGVRKQRS